jgi:hypothetical protein
VSGMPWHRTVRAGVEPVSGVRIDEGEAAEGPGQPEATSGRQLTLKRAKRVDSVHLPAEALNEGRMTCLRRQKHLWEPRLGDNWATR